MTPDYSAAEQHNREINENRSAWRQKRVLRLAYGALYEAIRGQIDPALCEPIVELGSGMGNIKEFVPQCITTDIFPNAEVDLVENAYALNFDDSSLGHLILFDVWHHIEFPANALAEFRRVLVPGGRVILLEPSMSPVGRFVYGRFHHEPLGFETEFPREVRGLDLKRDTRYFAAQSSCHRLIKKKELPELLDGWETVTIREIPAFAYLASGGFRGPALYPQALYPIVRGIDRICSLCPGMFSARLLCTLKKPI